MLATLLRSAAAFLVCASCALAGYRDAIVQIQGVVSRGGHSYQSGVIFQSNDNGSYVLTAGHFHRDKYDKVLIGIPNDKWYPARNIGYSKDWTTCDLSLFYIPAPNQDFIPISRDAIKGGEPCTQIGHPQAQSGQKVRKGRLLGLWQGRLLEASFTAIPGDSGAPILNSKNELIGIVTGYNRAGHSTSTPRRQIFTFLKRFCPDGACRVPRRRQKPVPTHPIEEPIDPPLPPAPPHDHKDLYEKIAALEEANKKLLEQMGSQRTDLLVLQNQVVQIGDTISKIDIPVIDYDRIAIAVASKVPPRYEPDYDKIANEVLSRLPGITFEHHYNGQLQDSEEVHLGESLPMHFRLVE